MPMSRRDFLKKSAMVAAVPTFMPLVGRVGPAFGAELVDPATAQRNRLVVIMMHGGNDGLNTIVPLENVDGNQRRAVYEQMRPTLRLGFGDTMPLDYTSDDAAMALGLHPGLAKLHAMYKSGRVAIVQGVDYPNHNYSHFESSDIWQSGQPVTAPDSGWLGRHLDRAGVAAGELRAAAVQYELPLAIRGRDKLGMTLPYLPFRFADGSDAIGDARHLAACTFGSHSTNEPLRSYWGKRMTETVGIVEALETAPPTPGTSSYLTNSLLTARSLLEGDYGTEIVFVYIYGFDTHASQIVLHHNLLVDLDNSIDAFYNGIPANGIPPLSSGLVDRTMVMTFSEFGRRLNENGANGTDHGNAAPLFLVGPPGSKLVGGIHGDHPDLGTTLLPADNLLLTTDMRTVYQSVLQNWLGDPDPALGAPMQGLFTS